MTDARPALHFDFEWRITLFTLVMVPIMVGLGFWQMQRAEEKASLAYAFELKQQQSPALLSSLVERSPEALSYLPVLLRGRFVAGRYFLLDNRIQEGQFGYEVLALFESAEGGELVLVNRGWIQGDPARLNLPEVPEEKDELELLGHVYVAPGTPYLLADQTLEAGWPKRIQAVEMDKLAAALGPRDTGLFPYPVRLEASQSAALSVDWQIINISPQKHRAYAVQWFTMAAVLFFIYLLRCSNLWQFLTGSTDNVDGDPR